MTGMWLLAAAASPAFAQSEDTPSWYEVDELNQGLGPAPEDIDRMTPRSTLESFLIQAKSGDMESAAHMLDLSAIEPDQQRERGKDLAQDFLTVLERKIVVDWYALRDRPDGLDARAGSDTAMAGKPRRSILLWYVDVGDKPVPIRINRIKAGDQDPVWVVSQQTINDLPAMGEAYGPSKLEQMLPGVLHRNAFWGLRWWEVLSLPLAILFTGLIGALAHKTMSRGMGRSRRTAPDSILVAARGPVVLLVMTLAMALITSKLFIFSGRIDTVLSPLIVMGIVVSILWIVVNIADAILERLVSFDGAELGAIGEGQEVRRALATRISALRRGAIVIIAMIGTGIVLNEASVMQSLGISLLASAGTLTILAAFAARNILANIMASLQISMNQSARIGDKVMYQGYVCSVERINFTFVQLRVWTGKRLVVPVVDFVAEPFENWTMQEHATLFEVMLRLDHRADVTPLRDLYNRMLDEMDQEIDPESRGVYVTEHDVFGQQVLFMVPSEDPNTGWALACEFRETLLAEARKIDSEATPIFPRTEAAATVG
ncbi:mechanosensitive ion channel [Rhodobacteraceae bacterium]|nr:mechanosensitive ion channel [Paracoccaceae bacterium]